MSSRNDAVTLTIHGAVAEIRLNRAEAGNGITREVAQGLRRAAESVVERSDLRCVLLRAEGSNFSFGGDIAFIHEHGADEYGRLFGELIDEVGQALVLLETVDVPIVAAVQGWAVGASLALLGLSDIVLAADDARFRTAFTGIGLPGDVGVTWYLTRAVGLRRAVPLILENNVFGADDAVDWGLVTRTVPASELDAEADALAERLAAGPTRAFALARRNLRQAPTSSLADQIARERAATVACAETQDLRNAIAAFVERRTPTFEGR